MTAKASLVDDLFLFYVVIDNADCLVLDDYRVVLLFAPFPLTAF